MGSDVAAAHWRTDLQEVVEQFASALDDPPGLQRDADIGDGRVVRLLRIIHRRHADPGLRMSRVAGESGVSIWQAGRLLKRETGMGFCLHLRNERTDDAFRLLRETSLTLKEITASVGYRHPSELSRHFRRRYTRRFIELN
jgi:AraC-like DNA-binding protein